MESKLFLLFILDFEDLRWLSSMPIIGHKPSGRHISWTSVVTELKQTIRFLLYYKLFPFYDRTCQASLSFTISRSLHKLMSIELMMPSNHLICCHPLLLLPSIFPTSRVFSNEWHQMAKALELQLQHQSFQWIFRVDFKIDLFDLLAVQGNRKRFLHNNIKSTENINAAKKWFLSFWDCKIGKYIGCQIKKKKPEITNARNESCNIAGFCRLSKDKQNIMNEFIAIIWQCRWNRHIPWLLKVTKD